MKRMAVISAGFVPVPAVDGGAGAQKKTRKQSWKTQNGVWLTTDISVEADTPAVMKHVPRCLQQ